MKHYANRLRHESVKRILIWFLIIFGLMIATVWTYHSIAVVELNTKHKESEIDTLTQKNQSLANDVNKTQNFKYMARKAREFGMTLHDKININQ